MKLTDTGTGGKRVTIPKDLLEDVFGSDKYVAVKKVAEGLLLQRVQITEKFKLKTNEGA